MTSSGWTIRGCDRRENLLGRRWGNEKQWQRERVRLCQGCARSFLFPHAACFTDGSSATERAHLMSHLHFLPHTHGMRSAHNGFVCQEAVVCLYRTMAS